MRCHLLKVCLVWLVHVHIETDSESEISVSVGLIHSRGLHITHVLGM